MLAAMGQATGRADLPLHGGRVPAWLATRMATLGRIITEAIVLHEGRDGFLRRLSHPFWFQAFGAVMGMDWHSSGITTSVMGALKRGLAPVSHDLGIHVCGGRGRHARKTPEELANLGMRTGLDADGLTHASRLVAKIDSAAVQDGFELYLHAFVATTDGAWAVVQQGMHEGRRQARRYHWLSAGLESFVDDPHAAVDGPPQGTIVNLVDRRAAASRAAQIELVREGPDRVLAALRQARPAPAHAQVPLPHLQLPAHHEVRASDVVMRRLHGALAAAAERSPNDFEGLLLTPGLGRRTLETLALVGEVIHGAPFRFSDPARFSYALGGKDGHPFPVPLRVYDETIRVLRNAIERARIGQTDRLEAMRRLDAQARRLERTATGPDWETLVARERTRSARYGGRSVGEAPRPERSAQGRLRFDEPA